MDHNPATSSRFGRLQFLVGCLTWLYFILMIATPIWAQSNQEAAPNRAEAILKRHCLRCHGQNGADEGGFDFALDRDKLVAAGYLTPQEPGKSLIIERMTSADSPMPPEGEKPRPSADEIASLRSWIQAGAKPFATRTTQPFVPQDQLHELVARDLAKVNKRDRAFTRYFSVVHLANQGYSKSELAIYQTGLSKLINSLSWNRQLASLKRVRSLPTVFRIDLRDLKWTKETWETIVASYPYGIVHESRMAQLLRSHSDCEMPIVRADWFVAMASRPPMYHTLLDLPDNDETLERLLKVDARQNIEEERVVRAGFSRSGVSQNNRIIERHESSFGAYWKSYDFGGNTERKNIFDYPLGPGNSADAFQHDGGEIIFTLPNGMLGFMLIDAVGRRIDRGPTDIVSDPRQPDRAVVNGISCMACHYGGFLPKEDEVRAQVSANRDAYPLVEDILAIYPEKEVLAGLLEKDSKSFLTALASDAIGVKKPSRSGEPIVLVGDRFRNELDLPAAAAELGLRPETLSQQLASADDPELKRVAGPLRNAGGVVKREAFEDVFAFLLAATSSHHTSARVAQPTKRETRRSRAARPTARTGRKFTNKNAVAAEQELQAGIIAMRGRKWNHARAHIEEAVRLAPNESFLLRVYEHALRLYIHDDAFAEIVTAHQFVLDATQGGEAIMKARNAMVESLMEANENPGLRPSWLKIDRGHIHWSGVKLPASVVKIVTDAFQTKLNQDPQHEPSLRVMETIYGYAQLDNYKLKKTLEQLSQIYEARGEPLNVMSLQLLATAYIATEEPAKGAALLQAFNKRHSAPSTSSYLREAEAWISAGDDVNANLALKAASKLVARESTSGRSYNTTKLGDLYMKVNNHKDAAKMYKAALKLAHSASRTRSLQAKLQAALADSGQPLADTDGLLDPRLEHRQKAIEHEKQASRAYDGGFRSWISAAKSWLAAEEPTKARDAMKQAERSIRRADERSRESTHAQLARLYLRLEDPKKAFEHFTAALESATNERKMAEYQREIQALADEHDSIKLNESTQDKLSGDYRARVQAKAAEEKRAFDPGSKARNFIEAAKLWLAAGDMKEVARCGKVAEASLKMQARENTRSSRVGSSISNLASIYEAAELYEESIAAYVLAIQHSERSEDAQKILDRVEAICDDEGLELPKLNTKTMARLDPLNEHRVRAAEYEKEAQRKGYSSDRYWMQAAEAWLDAEEPKKALAAANKAAKLILKDKSDPSKAHRCKDLGELYEQLDRNDLAKKAYQEAVKSSRYDRDKERYQERLDALE
jgi:mono/diheme cytochrome c family protein